MSGEEKGAEGEDGSVTDWSGRGPVARFHVGLEDPADLIRDLEQAFEALGSAAQTATGRG